VAGRRDAVSVWLYSGLRAGWVERVDGELSGVGRGPYDLDEAVCVCGRFGDGVCFGLAEGAGTARWKAGLSR